MGATAVDLEVTLADLVATVGPTQVEQQNAEDPTVVIMVDMVATLVDSVTPGVLEETRVGMMDPQNLATLEGLEVTLGLEALYLVDQVDHQDMEILEVHQRLMGDFLVLQVGHLAVSVVAVEALMSQDSLGQVQIQGATVKAVMQSSLENKLIA